MELFKTKSGKEYRVDEFKECEKHGRYPHRIYERVKPSVYGALEYMPGCPMCRAEKLEIERYGAVAVPPRFQGKTLQNYVPNEHSKELYDFCLDYAANLKARITNGTSIILSGRPGTGKTHLACALVMEAKRQGFSGLFTSVAKLVRQVRDTWASGSEVTESEVLDRYIKLDLLVIDEVGVQAGSDNERNILFSVINGRYEEMRPTILLSNEPLSKVKELIGERAFDRFREGGGRAFACKWDTYRTKAQAVSVQVDEKPASMTFYELPDEPLRMGKDAFEDDNGGMPLWYGKHPSVIAHERELMGGAA